MTLDSHQNFCTEEGLNFKLLADSSHVVVEQYGSIMEYNGMTLAARNTLLIDPNGYQKGVHQSQSARSERRSAGRSRTVAVREATGCRQRIVGTRSQTRFPYAQ
jgi:peroxiredoxin